MSVDYRKLLKKVIQQEMANEGIKDVDGIEDKKVQYTEEEHMVLSEICREIEGD